MNAPMFGLSILPAVVLLGYLYKKDTAKHKPAGMLVRLFGLGALTVVSALVIELALEAVVGVVLPEGSLAYQAVDAFLVVAFAEELGKYVVLRFRTWKSPHFNFLFDGVVFAVVVSLGFATIENVVYVAQGTVSTGIVRAILSVPGHAIDALFMGVFYARAKRSECMGDMHQCRVRSVLALVVPMTIHGFYDFCLFTENWVFLLVFVVFEIAITSVALKMVKSLSFVNTPLRPVHEYVVYSGELAQKQAA